MAVMKKLAFTICAGNYLSRASVLVDSIRQHNPEYEVCIFLIDRVDPDLLAQVSDIKIVAIDSVKIPRLSEMRQRYGVIEFSTAVKPFCFQHLFRSVPNVDHILYLDPDIMVFHDFGPIAAELADFDILITPHLAKPVMAAPTPAELRIAPSGVFNLGFIGLKTGANADAFLQWWGLRLEEHCHCDHKEGLFYDQSWINFVPTYFPRVRVSRHLGLNVAVWNLSERRISAEQDKGRYLVDETHPLVFFHFSQFKAEAIGLERLPLRDWFVKMSESTALNMVLDQYQRDLVVAGHSQFKDLGYRFPGRLRPSRIASIIFGRVFKRFAKWLSPEIRALIRRQIQGI